MQVIDALLAAGAALEKGAGCSSALMVAVENGKLDVTSCVSGGASSQKWAVATPQGSNASTIKQAGTDQCVALRTTPRYNTQPPLSRPGGW